MSYTASRLREDIYRILDEVLATGIPVDIERRGRLLRIIPVEGQSKLKNLKARKYLRTDAESIVHMDWSQEWQP